MFFAIDVDKYDDVSTVVVVREDDDESANFACVGDVLKLDEEVDGDCDCCVKLTPDKFK